jgi:hypothetical protein
MLGFGLLYIKKFKEKIFNRANEFLHIKLSSDCFISKFISRITSLQRNRTYGRGPSQRCAIIIDLVALIGIMFDVNALQEIGSQI